MVNNNQNIETIIPETQYLITYEQMNTIITFLRHWTNIASWTRAYLRATVYDLPYLNATFNQLYNIPSEFYNSISIFYGTKIAQEFINLLSNFTMSEMRLIEGMNSGDQELVNTNTTQLYQNAGELASFLSKINVYWDEDIWKNFLYQYIKMTIDEIIALMGGNFEQEIAIYNSLEDITVLMGSYMARGIIASSSSQIKKQGQYNRNR